MPKIIKRNEDNKDIDVHKLYRFHGVVLADKVENGEVRGECPFCTGNKFYVNYNKTTWDCKNCQRKGNPETLLEQLFDPSQKQDYSELKSNKGILFDKTLKEWSVFKGTKGWTILGINPISKRVGNGYRYIKVKDSSKYAFFSTPGMKQQLFGVDFKRLEKVSTVYICEGPWDGMCLRETMLRTKFSSGKYTLTGNLTASLLADAEVVSVPGAGTFSDKWLQLFNGKKVVLLFDNDHPKNNNGKTSLAGFDGMKRLSTLLALHSSPPIEIRVINWGSSKLGYAPELPNGYDVRDFLTSVPTLEQRSEKVGELLKLIDNLPSEWIEGTTEEGIKKGKIAPPPIECKSWLQLTNCWRKPMAWSEGLDRALSVMLACVVSTETLGDQLWIKVMSPPSTGKTTIADAISSANKYVTGLSVIRGFLSGYQTDKTGKEDNSLLDKLRNKTLVTKDGDTLLQSPNIGQILSEARDIYDGGTAVKYRNKIDKKYTAIKMTWILCGTASLRTLDSSELGERFLNCTIMDGIDMDSEKLIAAKAIQNTFDMLKIQKAEEDNEESQTKKQSDARRTTAGYVMYLRENALRLIDAINTNDEMAKRLIVDLGTFVAYMRARPSLKQDEDVQREFCTRLVSQHGKLAVCLAVVLQRDRLDEEVLRRTVRCALDTAKGRTFNICQALYEHGLSGLDTNHISQITGESVDKARALLRFMKRIHIVELSKQPTKGVQTKGKWVLTPELTRLFKQVVDWTKTEGK